jgi:lipoprotein Spr
MVSLGASAQIVTSKKEAQKKGTYSYTEKASATEKNLTVTDSDMASLLGSSPVVAYEPVKEIRRGGPSKQDAPSKKKRILIDTQDDTDFTPSTDNYLAEQLVNNAMQFEGVRYRGGGTTTAGMDCSGMVTAAFRVFDLQLPRSSHEMAKEGVEIDLTEVKKGDLLFFKNNSRRNVINHVGLVTEVTEEGEVKFLHASSSSGVIVSSMNEAYHKRTFVQANRVIGQ